MDYTNLDDQIIGDAPKWVQLMALIAKRIGSISTEGHLACAVAPPTVNYFPGALAAFSISKQNPVEVVPGESLGRVASLKAGILIDAEHSFNFNPDGSVGAEFLGMATYKEGTFPPMFRIPAGFPERTQAEIPNIMLERLMSRHKGKELRDACWDFFNYCANPVVVICQHPSKVAEEIEELALETDWWNQTQFDACLEPGTSPDDWFRRPVICMSPRAIQNREWLSELNPAAVIVIGYSAWSTPARWIWPEIPHILFLDSRSDDIFRFRLWHDGQDFPAIYSEFSDLKGVAGIPAKFFSEPIQSTSNVNDFDWDAYGADFD